ncbi:ATP-binding protein [Streptomyces radicis]|uniref:histidine kinase n=1 Tax=Streptomyces radicis TaxID=1750517 RepID=A0A3A9WCU6_9ACTN|nr:ATP-binding protein [Streptomyces radicis]RKN10600.1 sensor histidine kinase [Streptomyces radicis]RKN24860.1 sensor histidine kinase [Streptomyces radicis]
MTDYLQDPALWGLVVGTPLAAATIYRARKSNVKLRKERAELETRHHELESNFSEAVDDARLRAEEATKTALKSAMRTLQGLANEQQLAISKIQDKYGDQGILQDLLGIDHMNSQFGRRAQSVAVLCDGWLGRARSVASVYDVARSAKGRIRHYTRVEIRSQTNFAIISQAVEPVALVLAELLDNATSYSSPEAAIEINIRTVPKGVCVIIDDAGVGMNEEEKTRAQRLLSGENPVGVTELGNPPQFGFAVIGVLAARYGFSVSVDSSSPYGGVRAVVLLPQELLTSMPEPQEPTESEYLADEEVEATGTTAGGLPKRRRRGAIAIVPTGDSANSAAGRSSEETASIMGAFQRGTQSGRTQSGRSTEPSREGHDVQ